MREQLESIRNGAVTQLERLRDAAGLVGTVEGQKRVKAAMEELENLRVSVLGKKGELTAILKGMGGLSAEERPIVGQLANDVRVSLEDAISGTKDALTAALRNAQLSAEGLDVTMPGHVRALGHKHPITIVLDELKELFLGMGYEIAEGPEVELDYNNFEALNIPKDHPARDTQDTFYISDSVVLRTHTSPVQIRHMQTHTPPIRIICPGRVYRSDAVDATHSPIFNQIEGLVIDRGVTMGDLVGTLKMFAKGIFGEDTDIRLRPHHFPFTEPSAEVDVTCWVCHGKGCRVCKNEGWVELLGSGMVHPKVLRECGIDPDIYSGFAFGMGVDRIAMGRFAIDDLRLLFENDFRFLKQF